MTSMVGNVKEVASLAGGSCDAGAGLFAKAGTAASVITTAPIFARPRGVNNMAASFSSPLLKHYHTIRYNVVAL
jgi:hypothetical protein